MEKKVIAFVSIAGTSKPDIESKAENDSMKNETTIE